MSDIQLTLQIDDLDALEDLSDALDSAHQILEELMNKADALGLSQTGNQIGEILGRLSAITQGSPETSELVGSIYQVEADY